MKPSINPISAATREKATSAKLYIERRYTKIIQSEMEKKLNWEKLYQKMNALSLPEHEKLLIKQNILHKEAEVLRETRQKESIADFEFIKVIGKGAFGEVRLYKWKKNDQPVAIKRMVKSEMIFKNKILQAQVEQSIMAKMSTMPLNKHIVKLLSSFQDDKYLYLVMEYLGGGDMMNLLIKKDIFEEEQARFYMAQLVLAIQCVHNLKYIHRDLKPDNILIDSAGHLKLSDFGLCKHTEIKSSVQPSLIESLKNQDNKTKSKTHIPTSHKRKLAFSTVGTPDYVAPQVQSRNGYTETVDWWSLGVILFEMLVGYPPFFGETPEKTWENIQNWRKVLHIPKDRKLSAHSVDLIKKLINDEKYRLGTNGVEQIKSHPFFAGVDWKTIKESAPPNIPQLSDCYDTKYFDKYEVDEEWVEEKQKDGKLSRKDNRFVGYTFKQNPKQNSELLKALVDLDALIPIKSKLGVRDHSLNEIRCQSGSKNKQKLVHTKKVFIKTGVIISKTLTLNSNNVKQKTAGASKAKAEATPDKKIKSQTLNKSENLKKKV